MKCTKCESIKVVRNGKNKTGNQRYYCKDCCHSFQENYVYKSYQISDKQIVQLIKEGCGIRSIGRILSISSNTVIRRILKISHHLKRPYPILKGKIYEVDELFTYIRYTANRVCVVYSFEPKTGYVIDIAVGSRCKRTLRKVTETLVLSEAKVIYTDGLGMYEQIIPKDIYKKYRRCTIHIERENLNLRTHLKRLNRRTLCYSKSIIMLLAVVKIYFWYLV